MKSLSKKLLFVLLTVLIFTNLFIVQSFSEDSLIRIYVNRDEVQFDVPPTSVEGRTLVPVRALLEKLGAKVEWNEETKTVTAVKGQTTIQLQLENKNATVNGKTVELDIPLKAINGRTLVPLRFISENLGAEVKWDSTTQTITVTDKSKNNELENIPNDKIRNGYDNYTWSNGTTYEGNWDNNKVNGKGTLKYADGDTYSGSFQNNKKQGYGIYTWANGESYYGDWVNDKMSGYGIYTFKNGDVYDGNWIDGKMHGQGTYKFKDGRTLSGMWNENRYSSEQY